MARLPLQGQESVNAAVAARAAQAQGRFWEYHDLLYENQSSGFSDENLTALAEEAGLDVRALRGGLRERPLRRSGAGGLPGGPETSA